MLDPNVGGEYLILQILGNKMEEKTFMRKRLHLKKNLKIEPIKVLFREKKRSRSLSTTKKLDGWVIQLSQRCRQPVSRFHEAPVTGNHSY